MQDKDFDRFIREALENQAEPTYNPADWDMLEDRLANFNTPQAQPGNAGAGLAGGSMAKLGFVASAVLFTVLNTVAVLKPEIFENKNAIAVNTNSYQTVATSNSSNSENLTHGDEAVSTRVGQNQANESQDQVAAPSVELSNTQMDANNLGSTLTYVQPVAKQKTASSNRNQRQNSGKNNTQNWNTGFGGVTSLGNNSQSGNATQLSGGKPIAIAGADCIGNEKPVATFLSGSDTLRTKRLNITTCQALNLKVVAQDKDGDKVSITSNIADILPGAQLAQLENNTAQVEWKANSAMARQQPYMITFWLTDNRCVGAAPQAYQVAVSVTPAFIVNLNSATSIEKGQATILEVVGAPRGSSFRWTSPNGIQNISKTNRLEVAPTQTASYKVQVISPAGCVATDSARVEVVEPDQFANADQSRFIPNVITPNNDGSNDYFEAQLPEGGPVKLEIFDRWGKQVYYKENYQNNWNGGELPAGIYYYSISAGVNHKSYKGWVEVVR